MVNSEIRKLARLSTFLRAYGVVSRLLFPTLVIGVVRQTPHLADPTPGAAAGRLNWVIWNGVVCGGEPCHVPPMLFTIYIVWGVFFLIAANNPVAYTSFLTFTMWANLAHALIMAGQVPFDRIARAVLPYLVPLFAVLALCTLWPPVTTFLPSLLMGR